MARKPAVSVYIRIRNAATGKQQICPAVWQQKNKKLKAGFCLVGGREEEHPEGTYNLRYAVNGVSKWETLEGDADDVVRIRMQRREQLAHPKGVLAQYVGKSVTMRPQTPAEPTQAHYALADEIKTYLGNVEKLAPRTHMNYKLTLGQFRESCGKLFVHQITKQDLQAFDSFLLKRGDEDRTRTKSSISQNVAKILGTGRITQREATFCLLDQRMFECHWATLKKLAAYKEPPTRKIELLYFLGVGWLHRSISGIRHNEKMERWWGKKDWHKLKAMKPFAIAELVRSRFEKELGYQFTAAYPIYDREKGNRVMYYMIHASDHDEAPMLMVRSHRKAVRSLPRRNAGAVQIQFPVGRVARPSAGTTTQWVPLLTFFITNAQ